jgi:hypothetical protein
MLSERPSSDLTFRAPHSLVPGVSLSLLNNPLSIAVCFFRRCAASKKKSTGSPRQRSGRVPTPPVRSKRPPTSAFSTSLTPYQFPIPASPLFSDSGYRSPAPQTERLYPAPPPTASPRWHQSCWVFALPFAFLVPGTRIGAPPLHSQECIEHIVSDPLDSSDPTLTC